MLHIYMSAEGSIYYEFDALADALNTHWSILNMPILFERDRIRRKVECGKRTPWFYASAKEEMDGDFAKTGP